MCDVDVRDTSGHTSAQLEWLSRILANITHNVTRLGFIVAEIAACRKRLPPSIQKRV